MKDYYKAVAMAKLMGQELIDRAEELIPQTDGVKDIDIWIKIPPYGDIPEITVNADILPRRVTLSKVLELEVNP